MADILIAFVRLNHSAAGNDAADLAGGHSDGRMYAGQHDVHRHAKGEDIGEPAVRTEEYYLSRPCVGACRTAAEIAEKTVESVREDPLTMFTGFFRDMNGREMTDSQADTMRDLINEIWAEEGKA